MSISEEEKKAIEKTLIETINGYEEYYKGTEIILPQISEDYKNAKIILNLIDRLQKELEQEKALHHNIKLELMQIKKDLDFEPWSKYKVDGERLFNIERLLNI